MFEQKINIYNLIKHTEEEVKKRNLKKLTEVIKIEENRVEDWGTISPSPSGIVWSDDVQLGYIEGLKNSKKIIYN